LRVFSDAIAVIATISMLQAETCHRGTPSSNFDGMKSDPLAHLPSGRFAADVAGSS
jgi:hypothetical protein